MPRTRKGQATTVAPGQAYGEAGAQEEQQSAMPIASTDPIAAAQGYTPQVEALGAPGNPADPLTDGMSVGAGRNGVPPVQQPRSLERTEAEILRQFSPILAVVAASGRELTPQTTAMIRKMRALDNSELHFNKAQ